MLAITAARALPLTKKGLSPRPSLPEIRGEGGRRLDGADWFVVEAEE